MIGVDLAKSVFQLHAASMTGQPKFRKKPSWQSFSRFIAKQPRAVVVVETCVSAHYWAREMIRFGHEVKLIAPRNVKPFVKQQTNNAANAEMIVIAAQRPEMRFVEPKSEKQQSRTILFSALPSLAKKCAQSVSSSYVTYDQGRSSNLASR